MLKSVVLLNIFVETIFFQDSLIETAFSWIFCNIIFPKNTETFDEFSVHYLLLQLGAIIVPKIIKDKSQNSP